MSSFKKVSKISALKSKALTADIIECFAVISFSEKFAQKYLFYLPWIKDFFAGVLVPHMHCCIELFR